MVRVQIGNEQAELSPDGFECRDRALAECLEAMRSPYGPTPSQPDFTRQEAERISGLFGGRVVDAGERDVRKPGVIY